MNPSCIAHTPGLFSSSAPRKRQYKRSTVPESDGIFMPKIRPDFGCQSPAMSGIGGMRVPQGRAPLLYAVS